ncbi:MAG: exosome complex RNA-binding protein Rrp4 [Candidatus Nanohaloarchaea archaeon]|nr:exosome complex RNA-binding protein Rrp4 [Candidatus Nanohaloarchaea archaeon]
MSKLIENREKVVPGEALFDGDNFTAGRGTFREKGKIHSMYTGSVEFRERDQEVRVIPEKGKYVPQPGDSVIGEISRVSHSNWTVDINSPYDAIMPIGEAVEEYVDLTQDDIADWFDLGDLIVAKVQKVTKDKDVQLTMQDRMAKKLEGGRVINIPPSRVPRLIGRKGTMVNTIKGKTDCTIIIGQNGRVWINGDNQKLAVAACEKVVEEADRSGLTEHIEDWLEEKKGGER